VKAGGLTPSGTPTAAEVVTGLHSLKGDTLQGTAPPLTFPAGQPHPINCWYTGRTQNHQSAIADNGQTSCLPSSSS
jgi:branched-chain amino acid transport system substrate-binding protein